MPERIARRWTDGRPIRLRWVGARVMQIEELPDADPPADEFLCPGLIDVQINGFGGVNFCDPDLSPAAVRKVANALWQTGVTHILPTLITDSPARFTSSLRRLAQAAREPDLGPMIAGIHLEGPYLSSEDGPRGAHPLEYCKDPDWDEFQHWQMASDGRIKLVTLAPERVGSITFIRRAVASGVRVAIGHTAATRDEILAAVDAGATLATHLGNAAHDRLQRHHNYVYDQLDEDRLYASLIVDGHHLPPHLVRIFTRAKGKDRIILISDAVQYAGQPPGVYDAGYRQFEVRDDGFIGVVGEPRLAGSGLLLQKGIENFIRFTGATIQQAIACATRIPTQFLGLRRLGELGVGKEASFLRVRWREAEGRLEVLETALAGTIVHQSPTEALA